MTEKTGPRADEKGTRGSVAKSKIRGPASHERIEIPFTPNT